MDSDEKQALTLQFTELMQRIWAGARPVSPEEWSEVELTMTQVKTLLMLSQGERRMRDIAEFLGVGLSSGTSVIERLVRKDLVERVHNPSDRRSVVCCLTVRGRQEVERFWRIGQARIERMADILSVEELQQVVHAFRLLDAALAREEQGASSMDTLDPGQMSG